MVPLASAGARGVRGPMDVCLRRRGPWGAWAGRLALLACGGKAAGCWRADVLCPHVSSPAGSALKEGDLPVKPANDERVRSKMTKKYIYLLHARRSSNRPGMKSGATVLSPSGKPLPSPNIFRGSLWSHFATLYLISQINKAQYYCYGKEK